MAAWSHLDQHAARTFGAGSVGRALGVMNPLHIPITATSAPLAGYISDTTGSYDGVFWLYGGCCAGGDWAHNHGVSAAVARPSVGYC